VPTGSPQNTQLWGKSGPRTPLPSQEGHPKAKGAPGLKRQPLCRGLPKVSEGRRKECPYRKGSPLYPNFGHTPVIGCFQQLLRPKITAFHQWDQFSGPLTGVAECLTPLFFDEVLVIR